MTNPNQPDNPAERNPFNKTLADVEAEIRGNSDVLHWINATSKHFTRLVQDCQRVGKAIKDRCISTRDIVAMLKTSGQHVTSAQQLHLAITNKAVLLGRDIDSGTAPTDASELPVDNRDNLATLPAADGK